MKEEGDDLPTQVAMVTEEDGAPQVALITQDGAQQVQARAPTTLCKLKTHYLGSLKLI